MSVESEVNAMNPPIFESASMWSLVFWFLKPVL